MFLLVLLLAIILVAVPTHIFIVQDRSRHAMGWLWASAIIVSFALVLVYRAETNSSFQRQREGFHELERRLRAGEVDHVRSAISDALSDGNSDVLRSLESREISPK